MVSANQIDTPAFIIDEAVVSRNITAMQNHCNKQGLTFRPHIKTHKSIKLAKMQLDAGAAGINCQKISGRMLWQMQVLTIS